MNLIISIRTFGSGAFSSICVLIRFIFKIYNSNKFYVHNQLIFIENLYLSENFKALISSEGMGFLFHNHFIFSMTFICIFVLLTSKVKSFGNIKSYYGDIVVSYA